MKLSAIVSRDAVASYLPYTLERGINPLIFVKGENKRISQNAGEDQKGIREWAEPCTHRG